MKMLSPKCYSTYSRILRTLRARGETLDLFKMQTCADLVLAIEEGNETEARELAERLELDVQEVPDALAD